jgi:type IV fimbrial biogenesis protein FimT
MVAHNRTIGSKPEKNGTNDEFFVVPLIPFVGDEKASKAPFVCQFMPSGRNNGFTIFELVVTILIISIIATLAIPQMRQAFQSNRMTNQANSLMSDLTIARNHAMGRGPVVICTSSNGVTCNAPGDWSSGRLIFEDSAPNDFAFTAGTDRLIRYTNPIPTDSIQLLSTTFPEPLIFNAQGAIVTVFNVRVMALAPSPGLGTSLNAILCDTHRHHLVPGRIVEIRTNGTPAINPDPFVCP